MEYGTLAEKQRVGRRALGCFLGSVGIFVFIRVASQSDTWKRQIDATEGMLGLICVLISIALWIFGCGGYARWKGYSGVLAVVGSLCFLGLLILALLPDRWARALRRVPVPAPPSELSNYPR